MTANSGALLGLPPATAVSVSRNEAGSGVSVHRGPAKLLPGKRVDAAPVAQIGGQRILLDDLEPTGQWFLDRSGERLVVVHCYARNSTYVGGARRLSCSARRL